MSGALAKPPVCTLLQEAVHAALVPVYISYPPVPPLDPEPAPPFNDAPARKLHETPPAPAAFCVAPLPSPQLVLPRPLEAAAPGAPASPPAHMAPPPPPPATAAMWPFSHSPLAPPPCPANIPFPPTAVAKTWVVYPLPDAPGAAVTVTPGAKRRLTLNSARLPPAVVLAQSQLEQRFVGLLTMDPQPAAPPPPLSRKVALQPPAGAT